MEGKLKLSIIVMFIMISCGRETNEETIKSNDSKIVSALNNNQPDLAIKLIEDETNVIGENSRLLYLKAQAYSLKSKVDIYSLFPILKMKLFDVAITEWKNIRKYEKKFSDDIESTVIGDDLPENLKELREKQLKIEKKVFDKSDYEVRIYKIEEFPQMGDGYGNKTTSCYFSFALTSKHFLKNSDGSDYVHFEHSYTSNSGNISCKKTVKTHLKHTPFDRLIKGRILHQYQQRIKKIIEIENNKKILRASFTVFESVSIFKEVPRLDLDNVDYIIKAINFLKSSKSHSKSSVKLKANIKRQQALLGAFLITGPIKNSTDFEGLTNSTEFMCALDYDKLLYYYSYMLIGVKTIIDSLSNTDFEKKNRKQLKNLKKEINSLPHQLSPNRRKEISDEIKSTLANFC